jgi:ATP-dependent DNA helicase RecQ
VLLPATEADARIWDYFATATLPDPDMAQRTLDLLAERPMSTVQLEAELNSARSRVDILLKQLHVDGAVTRERSVWHATGQPWEYDGPKYDRVVRLRHREAEIMAAYARADQCLMQLLIEALDDPAAQPCGTCSVCTGRLPNPGTRPAAQTVHRALAAMRRRPNVIEPRKLWPTGGPWKGRIDALHPGRAVARGEDSGWGSVIQQMRSPDGPLSAETADALRKALTDWRREDLMRIDAVVPMPNLEHPRRVIDIARLSSEVLDCPVREVLAASPRTHALSIPSLPRVRELAASLSVIGTVPRGTVLLVDETVHTRWGLTVAGHLLRHAGAEHVVPFAAVYEG